MRASVIIRIVVWAFVAVLLTAVLVVGLASPQGFGWIGEQFHWDGLSFGSFVTYENANLYAVGRAEISPAEVEEIEINWIAGTVSVVSYDGDQIIASEQEEGLEEHEKMRYLVDDGKLKIQFCAPRKGLFRVSNLGQKALEVKVPASLAHKLNLLRVTGTSAATVVRGVSGKTVKLESVSGSVELYGIVCQELRVESTSGQIYAADVTAQKTDLDTVSGDTSIGGDFGQIAFDGVSGKFTFAGVRCPSALDVDLVSGDVYVQIPENEGFTAHYDTVSGAIQCEFPVVHEGESFTYLDGGAELRLESVSGNITIAKVQ